jgi:hypothetical protein
MEPKPWPMPHAGRRLSSRPLHEANGTFQHNLIWECADRTHRNIQKLSNGKTYKPIPKTKAHSIPPAGDRLRTGPPTGRPAASTGARAGAAARPLADVDRLAVRRRKRAQAKAGETVTADSIAKPSLPRRSRAKWIARSRPNLPHFAGRANPAGVADPQNAATVSAPKPGALSSRPSAMHRRIATASVRTALFARRTAIRQRLNRSDRASKGFCRRPIAPSPLSIGRSGFVIAR